MDLRGANLPDDATALKRIIAEQAAALESARSQVLAADARIIDLESEKWLLEEKVQDLIARLYSRKSEKSSHFADAQALLFNEIEDIVARGPEFAYEPENEESKRPSKKRRRRRVLADDLPRKERRIDIPEEEKICSCGTEKTVIGEDISEKLDYVPARAFVVRMIFPKYACKSCHGEDDEGQAITRAPLPPLITGKSPLAPGLFAHITVSKFADALPFYRQEIILRRAGADISRATMATLAIQVYQRLMPMKERMESLLKEAFLVGIDDTTLKVMNEKGRSNSQLSCMTHLRAQTRAGPVPYFLYHPTKETDFLDDLLRGFSGRMITDGYAGYNGFAERINVTHAGCNSHARRKFTDAEKVSPGNPAVGEILFIYKKLYRVEARLRESDASENEIAKLRHEESRPLMDELHGKLISLSGKVVPKSKLGKAVAYTLNEWTKLVRFLDDPVIPIDNNFVENGIRPFVVGRKNWLFSNTPNGAKASAFFYSLIEWAKALDLDPYLYMSYLFRNAASAVTEGDWDALLPLNLTAEFLEEESRQDAVS